MLGRLLLLLTPLLGCEGRIGAPVAMGDGPNAPGPFGATGPTGPTGPTGDPNGPPPERPRFPCDPSARGNSPTPLRRLSNTQYENTVVALFAGVPGLDAREEARSGLAKLPPDSASTGFMGMDARLSDRHAEAYYDVADALAGAISGDEDHIRAIFGACAAGTALPSATCLSAFLDDFGRRAFRRPLTAEERTRYLGLDDGSRDRQELLRSLLFSLLLAPQFLYQVEVEGPVNGTSLALDPYAIAARLAYHFWQGPPDAALLQAAADGRLSTTQGYRSEVERVFADPRTEATVGTFYREWLQLGTLTSFRTTAGFTAFAAGEGVDEPEADHLAAAAQEVEELARHFTFSAPGRLRDLWLTDLSFTRSPYLAHLYGVAPWDGQSEPIHLDPSERAGILTRVGMLVTGTHNTHPIHRGAVVRKRILCTTLTAPSPSELPPGSLVPPPVDPSQTTRERFANKVANEPCASCHTQMNPIGYVLERYDALGRFRTTERIYDDATGALLNELPVDSTAAPRIGRDLNAQIDSGAALSALVADSGQTEPCFARQYFRFTHHRLETPADSCALESVRAALIDGDLRSALLAIALDPSFVARSLE